MCFGIELKGRCCVVALGITTDGVKVPLGLWDGSTENKTVTGHLLADLIGRGLDVEQGVMVVLDGSKALRAAVGEAFGPVPVQRCVRHKERNVLEHLTERDRPAVKTGCAGRRSSTTTTTPPGGSCRRSRVSWPARIRARPPR